MTIARFQLRRFSRIVILRCQIAVLPKESGRACQCCTIGLIETNTAWLSFAALCQDVSLAALADSRYS